MLGGYSYQTVDETQQRYFTIYNRKEVSDTDITVVKVEADEDGKPTTKTLAGAKFYLKQGQELVSNPSVTSLASGNPAVAVAGDGTFVVPAEGVKINGLAAGTYTLVEVEAPKGYVITQDSWEFTVVGDGAVAGDADIVSEAMLSIPNEPGSELPNSGGAGTMVFLAGGLALAASGALMLASRRRTLGAR